MKHRGEIKICLVASAGGHLTQLLKLEECWEKYESFYVSTIDIVTQKLQQYGRTYIVGECNRQYPFKTLNVLFRCVRVVLKERPNIVISTGAAPGFLLCITARMFGAKIVWIDSIANVNRLSLSGRMVRPIADLFLVQWSELAEQYSNVEYVGAVV